MRRLRTLAILLATTAACSGGSGGPTGPVGPAPEYDFSSLTQIVQAALDTVPKTDSAAIMLLQDGHVIYERGFGGLSVDDSIPIASASKWLTAATVLALVDNGRVGLDVPMERYLETIERGLWSDPRTHEITLRQLLSLTAGFHFDHPCIFRPSYDIQECALAIGTFGLAGDPGTVMVYGQATFQVAGAVVEDATGESWGTHLQREILGPMDLTMTGYRGLSNPQLGDGAVASVRDFATFVQMIHDGGVYRGRRILSPNAIHEMTRDQTATVQILQTPRDPSFHYGLGVWREQVAADGDPLVLSAPGSLGVYPWIDKRRGLVGVVAIPPHLSISGSIFGPVLQEIAAIVPVR